MAKAMRIRKDDQVVVIGGKDAGKTGRVVRTEPKKNRVFVEHLNMVKRHERPRSVQDATRGGDVGGIVEKEGPIHVSNVMLLDPKDNKPHPGRRSPRQRRQARALCQAQRGFLLMEAPRQCNPRLHRRRACASATSRTCCRR